jgi:hypothetical protein
MEMRCRKVALRIKLIRAGLLPQFRLPDGFLRRKDYLLDLLCIVAPEDGPTQDALEWEVMVDRYFVKDCLFDYHPEADAKRLAMWQEEIVARYNAHLIQRESMDIMLQQIAA